MRALLTGASGFVGRNLHEHLLRQGWQIETIVRGQSQTEIDAQMLRFAPEVVIHLATLFIAEHKAEDIPNLIQSNITFGTQVVDSMVRHGVLKLVNAGTLWQYYEGNREVPSCLYAATKTAFETILKYYASAYSLQTIHLMISDTYGPGDTRPKLLPKLFSLAGRSEQNLALSAGHQKVDWTHISDIVEAFRIGAERLQKDEEVQGAAHYSINSGKSYSLRETVEICENVLKQKIPVEFGARPYRRREIMAPANIDPRLPGWEAQVEFPQGLEALIHG